MKIATQKNRKISWRFDQNIPIFQVQNYGKCIIPIVHLKNTRQTMANMRNGRSPLLVGANSNMRVKQDWLSSPHPLPIAIILLNCGNLSFAAKWVSFVKSLKTIAGSGGERVSSHNAYDKINPQWKTQKSFWVGLHCYVQEHLHRNKLTKLGRCDSYTDWVARR